MAVVKRLWQFLFSPGLYKIYGDGRLQSFYEPNSLERWGDRIINSMKIIWNIGVYTSPIIATVLYKKGYFVTENLPLATKVLIGIGLIFSSSYCIRALGRINNSDYVTFHEVLITALRNFNKETKKNLVKFDFEFSYWPVEFRYNDVEVDEGKPRFYVDRPSRRETFLDTIFSFPCRIISYLVAHTIGIKMVYPGSIKTLQSFMFPVILQGRIKLIEDFTAERFKLSTRDNNDIDSIFIDRRHKHLNGTTLVICCEGNAGFYEVGMALTPIEANYSVLGWNHPGFGGSTGTPFPSQEQNAIDCVMQFAIHHLGFDPKNILLFGWSIGGYTASWAAMNYPDIKGVILDATFDDILPLAIPRMPGSLEPIVRRTIREYINLNVYEQISKYNGPVTFIRRTEDEIICTEEGNLSTNRGNHLVAKFLKYRYPRIFDEKRQALLNEWLAAETGLQNFIWEQHRVDKEQCNALLISYIEDNSHMYPMQVGENFTDEEKNHMALFLVDNYLKNYRSTHCTPLPVSMFREPWTPMSPDSDYVKL